MINVIFISLVGLGLIFLFFQLKTYQKQKEFINAELQSLKQLRKNNIQSLKRRLVYVKKSQIG